MTPALSLAVPPDARRSASLTQLPSPCVRPRCGRRPRPHPALLLLPFALLAPAGCGVAEQQHNAVLRDLERTKASLAHDEKLLASTQGASQVRAAELAQQLEQAQGQLAALERKVARLEQEKGSLQQGVTRLVEHVSRVKDESATSEAARARVYRMLQLQLFPLIEAGTAELVLDRGLPVIRLHAAALFEADHRQLLEPGQVLLLRVGAALKQLPEGSSLLVTAPAEPLPLSDKGPLPTSRLAGARAAAVARVLAGTGLAAARIAASSRSGFLAPAAPEDEKTRKSRSSTKKKAEPQAEADLELTVFVPVSAPPAAPEEQPDGEGTAEEGSAEAPALGAAGSVPDADGPSLPGMGADTAAVSAPAPAPATPPPGPDPAPTAP